MKIKSGTHRTVIITKYLTIKFPVVRNPLWLFRDLFRKETRGDAFFGFKEINISHFTKGFKENWNEFMCWRKNRANFLVPVYFSIGLIEIQKTIHLKEVSAEEMTNKIWPSLAGLTRQAPLGMDLHTFANQLNYRRDGNQYKLIDYGGQGMGQFIKKYRKELEEIFSFKT